MSSVPEIAIVAVMVAWAVLFAVYRLLPRTRRRWLARCADHLDRPGHHALLRRFGAWLRPHADSGRSCGTGCATCAACGVRRLPAVEPASAGQRQPGSRH